MDAFQSVNFTSGQLEEVTEENVISTLPNDMPVDSQAETDGSCQTCVIA